MYPNYQNGTPDGKETGVASICGPGVLTLGGSINTVGSNGAVRNVLDDGNGNFSAKSISSTTPTVSTPALSSGVAAQNTSGSDASYMISLTSTGAGTLTVAIGPLNTTTTVLCTTIPIATGTGQLINIPVPNNWWIKITVANITINGTTLLNI